ncbi:hypothetical protein YC2023_005314 [Brassica napus]
MKRGEFEDNKSCGAEKEEKWIRKGDTCRQENGGSLLVWAKPKRIENQLFTSFSFSLAAIEYAIELSSTAYLLPGDGSPPDSITERRISSRASPLDGVTRVSTLFARLVWKVVNALVDSTKASDSSKRKTVDPDSQTETTGVGEEEIRPEGVKAAKAKRNGTGKSVDYYTTVLELRKVDLDRKEKLQKLAILDTLLTRTQPLIFGLHMGLHSYSQPSQDDTFGGAESDSDYNEVESLIQQDQAQSHPCISLMALIMVMCF